MYLSGDARTFKDDDTADVASGVRLLRVVDIDGEVGWGHGCTEAHSFGELVVAVPDLAWAVVYHLNGENRSMEILDLTQQHSIIKLLIINIFKYINISESILWNTTYLETKVLQTFFSLVIQVKYWKFYLL